MAQANLITKQEVRGLIDRCFAHLTAETEAHAPLFSDPDREINEQSRMVDERLQGLRVQIRSGEFEDEVERRASDLLLKHGYHADRLTPGLKRDLLDGVARALAEDARLCEFRLGERLLPYLPADPLFAAPPGPSDLPPPVQPTVIGPTVQETVNRYLVAKRKSWARKTGDNRRRQLDLLVEHLGPELQLRLITTDHMRAYRDGLLRLRRTHHVGASKSFAGRQTENEALRIEPKTALIQLQNARTFLRWAATEGYIEKDPSAGLQVELPKSAKTKKPRRPFTGPELEILFRSPLFAGCKSPRRRNHPGPLSIRDAEYWLPLLGYYSGARMGELVQLHVADIQTDAPVPFFEVTDDGSGELGSGSEKHVKSAAGIRQVPIHRHLVELGFLDFVRKRSKDKRATKRLFFEIPFGQDGQASSTYSKRFARLLDSVGLKDKALVFHSFRHTAEDALRDALLPQYVIDRIIGHADDSISSQYGKGVSLEVAADAVQRMNLPTDAKSIISTI